jgi:peptidylprolyl isomerase
VRVEGSGEPPHDGDMVETHYVGYLADGTQFDSSYDRGGSFRFPVGSGRVIRGWDEVFLLMRPGEKRRVIIPPQLAYGKNGFRRYGIPADATLVFDLELIQVMRRP